VSETPEHLVTGDGPPVTLFVHGLAMSVPDTRPFGSGVVGTKVFMHLRGHGGSPAPDVDEPGAWTYQALADDVVAVADVTGPTQGLGVSLGAGALLVAAVRRPDRFARLVLALPATVDQPRPPAAVEHAERLADAVDAADHAGIVRLLTELQPDAVRSRMDLRVWARRHADWLAGTPVSRALRTLPAEVPFPNPSVLASVDVPVLVLAQRDDPTHPVAVAEQLAELLPHAELVVADQPWLWGARQRLREVVGEFLNPVVG
jgi:pimeloyl-ACP methyl ester carboxylesterase